MCSIYWFLSGREKRDRRKRSKDHLLRRLKIRKWLTNWNSLGAYLFSRICSTLSKHWIVSSPSLYSSNYPDLSIIDSIWPIWSNRRTIKDRRQTSFNQHDPSMQSVMIPRAAVNFLWCGPWSAFFTISASILTVSQYLSFTLPRFNTDMVMRDVNVFVAFVIDRVLRHRDVWMVVFTNYELGSVSLAFAKISHRRRWIYLLSWISRLRTIWSASLVDNETLGRFLLPQPTGTFSSMNACPEVDLRSARSPAQSASKYRQKPIFYLAYSRYHASLYLVDSRNTLDRNLVFLRIYDESRHVPMANAISRRVAVARCIIVRTASQNGSFILAAASLETSRKFTSIGLITALHSSMPKLVRIIST